MPIPDAVFQLHFFVEPGPRGPDSTVQSAFWMYPQAGSLYREAAHLRWQIENNLFKRLNHLAGTKRFRIKDPRAFFNWLHLLCATVATLHALLHILNRHPLVFKTLRDGIKFTWRNLFSRLLETAEGPLFVPDITASG